jgi:CII-binding regulator of phage lambda lysogenization HflD
MTVSAKEKARMTRAWRRFDAEAKALDEHHEEWAKTYPDQFVAVYGGQLVAVSPDLETVLRALAKQGLRPAQALIRFMAKEPRRFLL